MRYNADQSVSDAQWQRDFNEAREKLQHEKDMDMRAANLQMQMPQAQSYGGSFDMGGAVGPAPKRKPPSVPIAVNELNTLAVNLMNVLVDLEKRLQPVMRSVPPETERAVNDNPGHPTQLGSMVVQASRTIDLAVNRVRDLLDRLEI